MDMRVQVPPSAHSNKGLIHMKYNFLKIVLFSFIFSNNIESINKMFLEKQYLEADIAILKLIDSDNTNASYFELSSKINLKLDNLSLANSSINKAIELDPSNDSYREFWDTLNDMRSLLSEAQKSFENGFVDEALESYSKLIKKYSNFALGYYNYGMIYYRIEDYDNAVFNLTEAKRLNPFNDKYKQAINNIAAKLTQRGNEEYRRMEYETALSYYKQANKYYPEYSEARFKSALILNKLSDFNSAKSVLLTNISYDSSHLQSYKLLGDMYNKLGIIDSAIYYYKSAVKINSNYDKAHFALGKAYINTADYDKAEDAFESAIKSNSKYAKAYENLGAILSIKGNNLKAIENYKLAILNDPNSFQALSKMASSYNFLKKYNESREAAKKSIDIKSKNAFAYFELGVAEKGLGNIVAAKSAFEKASKDKKYRKSAKYELTLIEKGL